jgi:hypothetical protein
VIGATLTARELAPGTTAGAPRSIQAENARALTNQAQA